MGQIINTNPLALVSQNNLNSSKKTLGTSIQRLSSGLRINSAKDDAAGLAIASRFTKGVKGLTQASRNASDGISLAQTTEGALTEVTNNLQRIRELTIQGLNGSYSTDDQKSIQEEIDLRLAEIQRVSDQTEFNGKFILSEDSSTQLQVGANDNEVIDLKLIKTDLAGLGLTGYSLIEGNGHTKTANPLATIDGALNSINSYRGTLGAVQNRLESVITNLDNTVVNLSESRSRIQDADYATEVSEMTRSQILQQAGVAVLSQANEIPQQVLSLLR